MNYFILPLWNFMSHSFCSMREKSKDKWRNFRHELGINEDGCFWEQKPLAPGLFIPYVISVLLGVEASYTETDQSSMYQPYQSVAIAIRNRRPSNQENSKCYLK